ncbi:MAG TPA: hypothetical protein VGW34_09530 [Allosphingosinicella sp.]|nr:hypothetical protein [Allosphingosinicella sp.]
MDNDAILDALQAGLDLCNAVASGIVFQGNAEQAAGQIAAAITLRRAEREAAAAAPQP